ncbi:MAG: hypothetical protein L3I99_02710 [Sulfurimonas sp.]|nr:hypothetical protein [Sulfurimonas sp.]
MKNIIKILLMALLFFSVANAKELDKQLIINKMIDTYGGEEKLLQLLNYKQTWNIEFMSSDNSGFDKREIIMPDYLRTEIIYPNKTEIRVLNKNSAIKIFSGKTTPIKGPMINAVKLQLMRLYSPLVLKSKLDNITVSQNSKQYIFELEKSGVKVEYIVSKKTLLIEKTIGRLQMGPQQLEFLTKYEEYKSVNGVMVPHKEIKFVGSLNTAVMTLDKNSFF